MNTIEASSKSPSYRQVQKKNKASMTNMRRTTRIVMGRAVMRLQADVEAAGDSHKAAFQTTFW